MQVITEVAGWIGGALFIGALIVLTGWLLRAGSGSHGHKW